MRMSKNTGEKCHWDQPIPEKIVSWREFLDLCNSDEKKELRDGKTVSFIDSGATGEQSFDARVSFLCQNSKYMHGREYGGSYEFLAPAKIEDNKETLWTRHHNTRDCFVSFSISSELRSLLSEDEATRCEREDIPQIA